jgi:hypothetical protein
VLTFVRALNTKVAGNAGTDFIVHLLRIHRSRIELFAAGDEETLLPLSP